MEHEVEASRPRGVEGDGVAHHGQTVRSLPLPLRVGENGERHGLPRQRRRLETADGARRGLRPALDDHAVDVGGRRFEAVDEDVHLTVRVR